MAANKSKKSSGLVPVQFVRKLGNYNPGDVAGFVEDRAKALCEATKGTPAYAKPYVEPAIDAKQAGSECTDQTF